MAAVGAGREEVSRYLIDGVVIACENSPLSVTLSGDESQVHAVISQLKVDKPGIFARKLRTSGMAYHSHHMKSYGEAYERSLQGFVTGSDLKVPMFSSVTGKEVMKKARLNGAYWRQNMESPVQFYTAIKSCLEAQTQDQLFVEIGPHSALAGPLRQIFNSVDTKLKNSYATVLTRGQNCTESFLKMVGQLYLQAVPVDFGQLYHKGRVLTDLPQYQWRHEDHFWNESRVSRDW
jgi:acyl transferase domain-containing protein